MAEIEIQMREILENASMEVKRAATEAEDKTAKEAVQKLRNTSPRQKKHRRKYAEGWSIKRERTETGVPVVTVYNKTNPQLTHLLENGHDVYNDKFGPKIGRANGKKHIAPVEQWAQTALPENFGKEFKP